MPPPRATAWPASLSQDPDVLTLDADGLFILCRVCADSYALYGGKTPKRVRMNARFRTRAWETHKRRTRAHRVARPHMTGALPADNSQAATTTRERPEIPLACLTEEQTSGEDLLESRGVSIVKAPRGAAAHSISMLLNPEAPQPNAVDGLSEKSGNAGDAGCCEGTSTTHDCYWTTMRQLFSRERSRAIETRRICTETTQGRAPSGH